MRSLLFFVAACVLCLAVVNCAEAQVTHITYYSPAVPVAAPVTMYYAPAAPVTTYYAPATVPITTYYAPAVTATVPVTTYYTPAPVVSYRPVSVATTRYRPILGGTVTRYRTAYSPVVVNPAPVVYAY